MMNSIQILKEEYPGDMAWNEYVAVFNPAWTKIPDQSVYVQKFKNEEIAAVLATAMGPKSLAWFDTPCQALAQRSPADVMKNVEAGTTILKSLLMRMHW